MFTYADVKQSEVKGISADASAITIASLVKNNHKRIMDYHMSVSERVPSGHLILQMISLVGYAGDADYEDIEWACRRRVAGIGSTLRLSSVGEYGQLKNGVFIPNQDELIMLVAEPINPDLPFDAYTPARYLYHEYTNINYQQGDDNPRGLSIIEINIVELMWQYFKAVEYFKQSNEPITSPVYVKRYVVNRMLPSYMDISFLNYHRAVATDTAVKAPYAVREIPVPPFHDLALRNATNVRKAMLNNTLLPATVLRHVPQFFACYPNVSDATDLIRHTRNNQTLQGTWLNNIVNAHLAFYCLQYDGPAMDKYKSSTLIDIQMFMQLRVLDKLPKGARNHLMHDLIAPLVQKVNGVILRN